MQNDRQRRAFALLLAGSVLLAFAPALWNGWVFYDEPQYLLDNPMVQRGLTLRGLRWAFTTFHASNWHPLTWISHMLDWQLFGARPWGHHLVALLLHASAAALCFLFLDGATQSRGRSFFAAALFALHPLRVESVAWAAERKDLLCGLFFLAACHAHVVRARRGSGGGAVTLFAALALLSKPMAVSLPVALLLLDVWPLRRQERFWKLLLEKAPIAALSAAVAAMTMLAQVAGGAVATRIALSTRLSGAAVNLVQYLRLSFWPSGLIPLYPLSVSGPSAAQTALALLLLTAITAAAAATARSRPAILMGWAWFVATLLPVLGVVQAGLQAVADRYTYLPHVGLAIACAWAVPQGFPHLRRSLIASGCAASVALASASFVQTRFWKDAETLFGRTMALSPGNAIAALALGVVRLQQDRLGEAEGYFRDSLRAAPGMPQTLVDLGLVLQRQGRTDESLQAYRRARDVAPMKLDVAAAYGSALARAGRTEEAIAEYRRIIAIEPADPTAALALGGLLRKAGRTAEALQWLRRAVALAPEDAAAHATLGATLASSGDAPAGVVEFERAAHLQPSLPGLQEALRRARQQVASR